MKFLCPACERLSELTQFRFDAGALVVRCEACGRETRTESGSGPSTAAAAPASASPAATPFAAPAKVISLRAVELPDRALDGDPEQAPEGFCPKCIAPRLPEAGACQACGLVYVNYVPAPASPELRAQWERVLGSWSDATVHDAFLRFASARGELPGAGRLYRIQLARRPADPLAARGRQEVIRLASASAASALAPSPAGEGLTGVKKPVQLALAALAVIVLGICVALIQWATSGP